MTNTTFPINDVGFAAYREGGSPPPPNLTNKIINAVSKPFRSSHTLPPFSVLISSKDSLCQGIDSEEAQQDPELVDRLLTGYCELKRKKGDSTEAVGRKLEEVEQETKDRHSSSPSSSLENASPPSSSSPSRAELSTASWPSQRLQTFAASVHHVRTTLSLPPSTVF